MANPTSTNSAELALIKEALAAIAALRKGRKPIKATSDGASEGVQEILTEVEDAIEGAIENLKSLVEETKDSLED